MRCDGNGGRLKINEVPCSTEIEHYENANCGYFETNKLVDE